MARYFKNSLMLLFALFVISLGFIATAQHASTATSRPVYQTPQRVQASIIDCDSVETVWNHSPYANFYTVVYADNIKFDNRRSIVSRDINVNSVKLKLLKPNKTYYFMVRVSNWEGQSLSNWSAVKKVKTLATCNAD